MLFGACVMLYFYPFILFLLFICDNFSNSMFDQLPGPHVGHFSDMIAKMKEADSLSVLQVRIVSLFLEVLHFRSKYCKSSVCS